MTVFSSVSEEQSFSAAARRLDLSPAAVTRAIACLEARLNVKLLLRTTRSVRLTEAGHRYLNDARNILASVAEANEAAAGVNAAPKGNLAVTAPVMFGRLFVMPSIVDYLRAFPEVEVAAYFLDRVVNLVDEGMDVAIRIGHLPDSGLKAVRVGQVRRVICASPDYLARNGTPRHPSDLLDHTLIAASSLSQHVEWRFNADGNSHVVRMKPRLAVTNNDTSIDAAVCGLGLSRLFSYQIGTELAQGRLSTVLADYEETPWPVHILHRESKYGSAKVRNFIDLLAAQLRTHAHLS